MAFELVYTSIPRGIKQGASGFCTAAYTNGLGPNIIMQLEGLSGYKPIFPHYDANADKNPVAFSHYICSVAGKNIHVLSRICFCGLDYTKRSNKLAHHIVPDLDEMDFLKAGPSSIFHSLGLFLTSWSGDPKLYDTPKRLPSIKLPLHTADTWASYTGDAGWAGVLAQHYLDNPGKPAFIVFDPLKHLDLLSLVDEAIQLLPERKRWSVTFNTYLTTLPAGVQCVWRFCIAGSETLSVARRTPGALVLDLTQNMGAAPDGSLQKIAKTGIAPSAPKSFGVPPPPVVHAPSSSGSIPQGNRIPTSPAQSNQVTPVLHPVQNMAPRMQPQSNSYGNYPYAVPRKNHKVLVAVCCLAAGFLIAAAGTAFRFLNVQKEKEEQPALDKKRQEAEKLRHERELKDEKERKEKQQLAEQKKKEEAQKQQIAAEAARRKKLRNELWKQTLGETSDILEKNEKISRVCFVDAAGEIKIEPPGADLVKNGDHTVIWGKNKNIVFMIEVEKTDKTKEWLLVQGGFSLNKMTANKKDDNSDAVLDFKSILNPDVITWAKDKKVIVKSADAQQDFNETIKLQNLKDKDSCQLMLEEKVLLKFDLVVQNEAEIAAEKRNKAEADRKKAIQAVLKMKPIQKAKILAAGEKLEKVWIYKNGELSLEGIENNSVVIKGKGMDDKEYARFTVTDENGAITITAGDKNQEGYDVIALVTNQKGHTIFCLGENNVFGNVVTNGPKVLSKVSSSSNPNAITLKTENIKFSEIKDLCGSCMLCLVTNGKSIHEWSVETDSISVDKKKLPDLVSAWERSSMDGNELANKRSQANQAKEKAGEELRKLQDEQKEAKKKMDNSLDKLKGYFVEKPKAGKKSEKIKEKDLEKAKKEERILEALRKLLIGGMASKEWKEKTPEAQWEELFKKAGIELEKEEGKDKKKVRTEAGKSFDALKKAKKDQKTLPGKIEEKRKDLTAKNEDFKKLDGLYKQSGNGSNATTYEPEDMKLALRSSDEVVLADWDVKFSFEQEQKSSEGGKK